jgi:hypothetical protein
MGSDYIKIEARFKKGEIDEAIINIIKVKMKLKDAFLLGVLKFLENEMSKEDDKVKRKMIEKRIAEIKRCLGIL